MAVALLMTSSIAEAHERREVAGYDFVVGFNIEPAFEGQSNAVLLRVAQNEEPIEGLAATLEVEVTHIESNVSRVFPLEAAHGNPGTYNAGFIPSATGEYRFRFFGAIEGTSIDEVFESGEGTFSSIESSRELFFPEPVPSGRELQSVAQGAQQAAFDADDRAASAEMRANIALGVGALAVVAALAVGVAAMKRRT